MKKILMPTDFTEGSVNAYKYAINFAKTLGAKLTLYYVFNKESLDKHVPGLLFMALKEKEEEKALVELENYGKSIQRELGIEVPSVYILEEGRPVKSIVEYADFMEADFIVMGTWWAKGVSGMVDTWLGNVGTKVVNQTHRPVLLVPKTARFQELKHIGYATNFKEKKQRIPQELVDLSDNFDLNLSCLHVRRPESDYNEIHFAFLKEMYRLELDNFNIFFYSLTGENVIESLNTFVEKEKVDMLAVLTHENLNVFDRMFGPDISQQMAFHTQTPLLVMHQGYTPSNEQKGK